MPAPSVAALPRDRAVLSTAVCFAVLGAGIFCFFLPLLWTMPEHRNKTTHWTMLGSFFSVLGAGSMAWCVLFLVPRYTGRPGLRNTKMMRDLQSTDGWVWS